MLAVAGAWRLGEGVCCGGVGLSLVEAKLWLKIKKGKKILFYFWPKLVGTGRETGVGVGGGSGCRLFQGVHELYTHTHSSILACED